MIEKCVAIQLGFALRLGSLVIRTNTNCPELKFVWLPQVETTALTASVQDVLAAQDFGDPKSRGLIFVAIKVIGGEISQALGLDLYCGGDLSVSNITIDDYRVKTG